MSKPCKLLALPAELKNEIYRYALLTPGDIKIRTATDMPAEPGLLRTCREIRSDAIKIYYQEYIFHFNIRNYDARHLIKWFTKSELHKSVKYRLELVKPSPGSWDNLMIWLEAHWRLGVPGLGASEGWTGGYKIVVKMFTVARKEGLPGQSWREIAGILGIVKRVLENGDVKWI